MIARHIQTALLNAAGEFPIVSVTGPRQSGKTTLVRSSFPDYSYVSLEDPDQRRYALGDPRGFLSHYRDRTIFDEVQRVPELFSYIQVMVDEDSSSKGRFILSGSQNFLLMRSISQSLAGRCAVLHLPPLSRAELAGEPLQDMGALASADEGGSVEQVESELFETLYAGGYPRIHDQGIPPHVWLESYYQTYVERDVRELLNVGDLETFGRFIGLCAGRVGQLLNLSSLANDCGVTHATARRWLSVLEASFIVTLLRPYHANFNKRLVKSPKLYFLDCGLLCYILRIRKPSDLALHPFRGGVFESWVVSEAIKNFMNRGLRPDVSFWRDSTGHEVDLLIEEETGNPLPVEIKSGKTFNEDFVQQLDWWRKISGLQERRGVVLYGGDISMRYRSDLALSWRKWY